MPRRSVSKEQMITVNYRKKSFKVMAGVTFLSLIERLADGGSSPIVAVRYNNELLGLHEEVKESGSLEFLDLTTEDGLRVYRQSLVMLLTKAVFEAFPRYRVIVRHSMGKSYYCEIEGLQSVPALEIVALEAKMRELVEKNISIIPQLLPKEEAKKLLQQSGHDDTVELLHELDIENITLYSAGSYSYYSHIVLAAGTGALGVFKLELYQNGFLLRFPAAEDPSVIASCLYLPKLGQIWNESAKWAEILGVCNMSGLLSKLGNDTCGGRELIHVNEALHEKKIAQIADVIFAHRDRLRIILIAGPSSSGKTTFAQRLAIQLRVLGLKPVALSTDDYFVNRDLTPLDEKGEYDFEALETVDVELFNKHLQRLMASEEVECPFFNFQRGVREEGGQKLQVEENNPIIIEGIHALNEKLTPSIRRENKYKIYISALTQLLIDDSNRIKTTDTRLLRRIVRDKNYRSQNALDTLKRWQSVRRGEEKNIFPYQEDADIMFNSALVYEIPVLKKYAYPLLKAIEQNESEYSDAKRLLDLIAMFPELSAEYVPLNSIMREFIGGSSIHKN